MFSQSMVEGIVVGAAGGAAAGLVLYVIQTAREKLIEHRDKRRILMWLRSNVRDSETERYRSTRAIASYTNLPEDRVRYICSIHADVYLSTGEKPDMWGLYGVGRKRQLHPHEQGT
jgi:hypothetical protein